MHRPFIDRLTALHERWFVAHRNRFTGRSAPGHAPKRDSLHARSSVCRQACQGIDVSAAALRPICLGVLLCVCAEAMAEGERFTEHTLRAIAGDPAPAATIDAMAWLAGRWRTQAFGGIGEETWLPPTAGAMVGAYRQSGEDGVSFYELLVISEERQTLVLKLKHFDAALQGWESQNETVDFPLVALEADRIHFEGMSFHRRGPDEMTVFLAVNDGAAEVRFDYRRF